MEPPLIVTDFDGTLCTVDVGNALCERYADPQWESYALRFRRGEMSLPEAQRHMWGLVDASLAQLTAAARELAVLRAGADALFDSARRGGCEVVVASGGFGFYIEALLGPRIDHLSAAYFSHLQETDSGLLPEFPHAELSCERCAVCKAKVIARHVGVAPRTVIFCGDGSSDCCVAGACEAGRRLLSRRPRIFTVGDRALSRYCDAQGVKRTAMESYDQVLLSLQATAGPPAEV